MTLDGATLHEVALPIRQHCLAVSASTAAVAADLSICLVNIEAANIAATLPSLSSCHSIAFNDQETKLACGGGRLAVDTGDIEIFSKLDSIWTKMRMWKTGGRLTISLIWQAERIICSGDSEGEVATWDSDTGSI